MSDFINKLFSESRKFNSSLEGTYNIGNLRFVFSTDYSCPGYFSSRLVYITFPGPGRDFSSMCLMEKIQCTEREFLSFDEMRFESDPVYMQEELARLRRLGQLMSADYKDLKARIRHEMRTSSIETMRYLELTKRGSEINALYQMLLPFIAHSYAEIQETLCAIEEIPAWDQALIREYRASTELCLDVLNRIILLENAMCRKYAEKRKPLNGSPVLQFAFRV
ncbi:MAG: hypothetical protein CSA96_03315 [Bacteroidetes bacterium]|nr:MAG: hypothetical protein CSA96_03315 [Bacteroidota bacterium]